MVTYAIESRAELDKQTDATLSKNVKFDAYFADGLGKTHYKQADINKEPVELVVSIDVQKEGYLKNATIDMKNANGEDSLNFTVSSLQDENAIIQSSTTNQQILRQINAEKKIEFSLSLVPKETKPSIESLSQENVLTLKGLYIDANGEETPIDKDIKINLDWTAKYEAELKQNLVKYIQLEQEEGNKTLISMQLEAGLKQEQYMLPVEETRIEIDVPRIADEKPEEVTVTALSTEATNGLKAEKVRFTEGNWKYDEQEGKLEIQVYNEKKVTGSNTDTYIINYIYSDKVYQMLKEKQTTIDQKAKLTMSTFTANGTEDATAAIDDKISLNETIGKLISVEGANVTETIPKGKLYANLNNPQNNDSTEYEYKWLVNIAYTEGLEGIVLEDVQERMVTERLRYELQGKTTYKQIVFNSNSFDELLGEEGRITIYNKEDKLLGIVAKDTRTDKDGNYLVELLTEVSQIKIVTSKPIKSGNLVIDIKKEIKSDFGFSKAEIDAFTNLEAIVAVGQIENEKEIATFVEEKAVSIPLEASVTKSQISINKEKLSTLMKNEDVEITIELGNDNVNSDLYVDPIFEIELPKCVENVEIVSSKILFDEELTIEKVEYIHKDGVPVIRVMLDGVQTKFSSGVVNGTNVVLTTNIVVNRFSPSSIEEIKMYYFNSNTVNYENGVQTDKGLGGLATTNIEFSAPIGMLTISGISNFDGEGNTLMSINQGEQIELVDTYKPSRTLKMHAMVVNNTGNTCSNVVLVGRIPFAGDKDLETGESLGTTIDTALSSRIISESLEGDGVKIYYTENGEATTNLGDSNNGWTLEPTNLNNVKSYMVVLENYEMPQGQIIEFNYDIVIPANMGYNQIINNNFGVYFVNNTQVATISSFAKSDKVGITTGTGPELVVTQKVEGAEDGKIDSYKILKYTINVTNVGTEEAINVTIENQIPKWTSLVRSKDDSLSYGSMELYPNDADRATMADWNVIKNATDEIGSTPVVAWNELSIQPGETITKELYVMTNQIPGIYEYYSNYQGFSVSEDGKYYITTTKYDTETNGTYEQKNEITSVPEIDVQNISLVTASNINATLKSSSETVTVEDAEITIEENCELNTEKYVQEGQTLSFGIGIVNLSEQDKTIKVQKILPEGLKYKSAYIIQLDEETYEEKGRIYAEYDNSTRLISFEEQTLSSSDSISIAILVEVEDLVDLYEKEITTNTSVYIGNEEVAKSDEINFTVVRPHYTLELQATNTNSRINAEDVIEYYININNIGKTLVSNINITQFLPKEFVLVDASYVVSGITEHLHKNSDGNINLISMVDVGSTLQIIVRVKVGKVSEDTDVVIYVTANGTGLDTEISNFITQTIEKSEDSNTNNNNNNPGDNGNSNNGNTGTNIERTYKIAGTAWLDRNENGIRENDENFIPNIMVIAINANTGEIAKDSVTGENIQASTGTDGKYLLTNLKPGNYLIIFKYDTVAYSATTYQIQGGSELNNSDAIEKQVSENGEVSLAGVTNTLNINSTLSNIDIGLIEKAKFDLKLEKAIKQITIQNGEGVKVHNYDYSKFAKVEVTAKQMKNTTAVIEYAITITNEGNVPGYAKQIVDYKPGDLTFNSDLNSNWYLGNDGNVYTDELEKTIINPGETKEIKLVLTKKMTEASSTMLNNRAEIKESSNELGVVDRDSTPGNEAQGEDDIGLADVIITIRTGEPVFYILITIVSLMILAIGTYLIQNKVTKKKEEVYR